MKTLKHTFIGVTEEEKIQRAIEIMHRELRPHEVRAVLKGHCDAIIYATAVPKSYGYQRYCEVCRWENGIPKIEVLVVWPNRAQVVIQDGDFRRKIISVQLRRLCRRLGLTPPGEFPIGFWWAIKGIKIGRRSARIEIVYGWKESQISVVFGGRDNNDDGALFVEILRLVCVSDWWKNGPISWADKKAVEEMTRWIIGEPALNWRRAISANEVGALVFAISQGGESVVRLVGQL